MLKFVCDNCGQETKCSHRNGNSKEIIPNNWVSIDINKFHNESKQIGTIYASGLNLHFCSPKCFNFYFFKEKGEGNE